MEEFCRVAVDSPVLALDRPFDYRVPERMRGRVRVGSVVRVRLHGRRMRAYVTSMPTEPAVPEPTTLSALVSDEPLFDPETVDLARWASRRYLASLGSVLHLATPGRFSAPPVGADPAELFSASAPGWLADPGALETVVRERGRGVLCLPHPAAEPEAVAGAVGVAAANGQRTLVVAPRIDVAERLAAAVPGAVLLHSGLRPAARAAAWARARDGEAAVVVGGRAALFAPLPGLGLVLVASAHDRTLKEERTPRLHALVVAEERASRSEAAFVASSPAPPLELASGDRAWLEAAPRARSSLRPEVVAPRGGPVTERLLGAVGQAVRRGRDALVFIGRKGLALRVRCRDCGWFPRCEVCGTGLAIWRSGGADRLHCRACGRDSSIPRTCPACGGAHLDGAGWGDERLAGALRERDLGAPVLRVDADSPMPSDRPHPAVIVGTQAAIWALEPGSVGTACVADLDQLLGLPDFRAGEHAYGLLWEVASALETGGRYLLQTREAHHHVVQAFTRGAYGFFVDRELPERKAAGYPPYGVLIHADVPEDAFDDLRGAAHRGGGECIGPLPRRPGRVAALVRASELEPLLDPLRDYIAVHPRARIDVDPSDVL